MSRTVRSLLQRRSAAYREYLSAVVANGQANADSTGLHATDVHALDVLQAGGPLTAGQLAEKVGLSTGATTRLIDRLEKLTYVRRDADPQDRRSVKISVTSESIDYLSQVFEPTRRQVGELLQTYSLDQLEVLFDYFVRAAPVLREAAEETRRRNRDGAGRAASPSAER
ncbi:DNA-binding MarR family transcriptional regulator [Nakamurella sp. UYEF19]|uniref:MarR family winged helix-turn-helix transcriptional regulator n=1 Tax=Nakamurella sp. UYEF19 TaxID=1756392 RepID=UPI003396569F